MFSGRPSREQELAAGTAGVDAVVGKDRPLGELIAAGCATGARRRHPSPAAAS
jgi:hypothetical protein